MAASYTLRVNGQSRTVRVEDPQTPLLYVLRNDLDLHGPRFGFGTPEKPHPIQQAFIEEQAVQCGYCANGMIMQSKVLLDQNKNPSEAQIKQALANNLCRCGTHVRIVRAVKRAAEKLA